MQFLKKVLFSNYASLTMRVEQADKTNTTDSSTKKSFNIVQVNNASQLETTILKTWAGD